MSSISHALKTPLAVIIGYGELLGARDDAAMRLEAAGRILEAAERLSTGIESTLTVLALDLVEIEPEPVELDRLVAEAISLTEPAARDSITQPDASWPVVQADPERTDRCPRGDALERGRRGRAARARHRAGRRERRPRHLRKQRMGRSRQIPARPLRARPGRHAARGRGGDPQQHGGQPGAAARGCRGQWAAGGYWSSTTIPACATSSGSP